MKKLLCVILMVMLAFGCAFAEGADVYVLENDKTVILDQDGLTIWLTGDYEANDNFNGKQGNFMSKLKCVVENNTGATINVQYTGVVNGWNIDSYHTMDGANTLPDGTKAKSYIWFVTEDCDVTGYADLETMVLNFFVRDENGKELYKLSTGTLVFNSADAPAEEAPSKEAPAEEAPAADAPADETPADDAPAGTVDAQTVDALLQGKWTHSASGGVFTFTNGSMTMQANGTTANGTYTIDTAAQNVDILIKTVDNDVTAHLPFTYENGVLALFNNHGEALEKEGGAAVAAPAEETGPQAEAPTAKPTVMPDPETPVVALPKRIVKASKAYQLYLRFRNDTGETVDRIDFLVYPYDASGKLLPDSYGESEECTLDDEVLAPGETSMDGCFYLIDGAKGEVDHMKIVPYYYHTTGGKSVTIPAAERVWFDTRGTWSIGSPTADGEYQLLEVGSRGEDVKKLQRRLIDLGFLSGGADGVYGNGTAGAVKQFQAAEGLPQTGAADAETQERLFGAPAAQKPVIAVLPKKLEVNSAGTTELYVRFRNDGDVAIDRLDFHVYCFDTYGDPIKGYGRYDLCDNYYDHTIKPGATSDSDWYWGLYGFDGTSRVRIAVYKYHTVNGDTVSIPNGELQWIDFE